MTFSSVNKRLNAVGYRLVKNYVSPLHGKVPYATLPLYTGGTSCHRTLSEANDRAAWIEKLRSWDREFELMGK